MTVTNGGRNAIPGRDELIDRARTLIPAITARADEAEALRRLPDATQAELIDAGLYNIYLPKRYGGYENDIGLQVDLAAELGRACGSTGWVHAVVASHSWMHGMFEPRCQDEVWGDDPGMLISGSTPTGNAKVEAVDGGFLLNGTWTFASGTDVAGWNHFNMFTPRTDGATGVEHRYGAVPRADYELIDDWYSIGLKGTGSKSMTCSDVFVPEYRTIRSEQCRGGVTRGSGANPGPIYRMPLFALFAKGIVGPGVGIARGALETTLATLTGRKTQAGLRLLEQPTAQVRVARAASQIEAAWTLMMRDCSTVHAFAEKGEEPPMEERMRWRRNDSFAGNMLVDAVDGLMPLLGAFGLTEKSPMQRAWRDIHAVAAHIAVAWDAQGSLAGRVLLGLPSSDPKI